MKKIRDQFWHILGRIANDAPTEEEKRITRDPHEWTEILRSHGIMVNPPGENDPEVDIAEDVPSRKVMPFLGANKMAWVDDFVENWIISEPYTDGACSNQGSKWARAGYGIYYYPKCPRNLACPLGGMYQGSDRAELRAALHALERHKTDEMTMRTDNKSVKDGIRNWKDFLIGECY